MSCRTVAYDAKNSIIFLQPFLAGQTTQNSLNLPNLRHPFRAHAMMTLTLPSPREMEAIPRSCSWQTSVPLSFGLFQYCYSYFSAFDSFKFISSIARLRGSQELSSHSFYLVQNCIEVRSSQPPSTSFSRPKKSFVPGLNFMASIGPAVTTVLEVCQVTPTFSPGFDQAAAAEACLPLTFFDLLWYKFQPVERLFSYELTDLTPASFDLVIVPKLKESLSITLGYFFPLAGKLTWPPHASKPAILCNPDDDDVGVSLTVAESSANFHHLLGINEVRDAAEAVPYVPQLPVSDSCASSIALQVTSFPNQGFCIGITSHHALLDGKSTTLFMKAWAHICKQMVKDDEQNPTLPPELTPFLDRKVVQDPDGLDMVYLNNWLMPLNKLPDGNPRSLMLPPSESIAADLLRATFKLSRKDLKKLRERVLSHQPYLDQGNPLHLSTFVLTFAYLLACMVKARGKEGKASIVHFGFTADCRSRLDPPMPENYFGNCNNIYDAIMQAEAIREENGFPLVAQRLSGLVQGLEKGLLNGAADKVALFLSIDLSVRPIGVAGSVRFGVYGVDFGWGRPKKVEITSIFRTGAISMAESRDESGGVEVGLALEKREMDVFESLFFDGLKDL